MTSETTQKHYKRKEIKDSHFPVGLFGAIFGILLLMSGIHMGIVQLFTVWDPGSVVQTMIPILYWCAIAYGITAYTRHRMKKSYEIPMKRLAKATDEVAHGDFSVYVAPLHTPEKLDYLDVLFMDFNKMVEELGSIETLKTDFFSNVSHEIKTPLAVISNYAQLLERQGELTVEQQESVDGILQGTRKLSALITNILKLNRLEKQVIHPEVEPFDVCEQLCECAIQFEEQWEKKNIEFDVDVEEKVLIEGDKSLLELVWNNLFSNALKFTEDRGRIRLEEYSSTEDITVKVTDSGCGMSEETRSHIFDKFYQGDTSHATEGNGLGLALAMRVIQLSGGEIKVESQMGKGTTFTVILPKKNKEKGAGANGENRK